MAHRRLAVNVPVNKGEHSQKTQWRTLGVVLKGTLCVVLALFLLLVVYEVSTGSFPRVRTIIALGIVAYLLIAFYLYRRSYFKTVSWLLISFYEILAFLTLLQWGVNAPVGVLTASFAVVLPGILLGARYILPVTLATLLILSVVQILHSLGVVSPNLEALSVPSTHWDVLAYATILSIFALVSWLSGSQIERSLKRARHAEARLKLQKENLRLELAEESRLLRQSELQQMRQLHKFALLGQSTAATLHELSNHLSVLNFDIEDMRQQRDRSSAIARAQTSVEHINSMVRQSRKSLDTYDTPTTFSALKVINQTVADLKPKFSRRNVAVSKTSHGSGGFVVTGSSMALMQIITILLNNALDACHDSKEQIVSIDITYTKHLLKVSIQDSGPGISVDAQKSLFKPQQSSKPTGLGVGLYIARNLARHQFNGDIVLDTLNPRTTFILEIPRNET